MPREIKKKNIGQDVIPPKRSIRNVELSPRNKTAFSRISPERSGGSKTDKATATNEPLLKDFTVPTPARAIESTTRAQTESELTYKTSSTVDNSTLAPKNTSSYTYEYTEPRKTSKRWLYISVVALLVVVAFGVSSFFKSAKISVTPKQQTLELNQTFITKKDGGQNDLQFQVVTSTKTVTKKVDGGATQKVDIKATGTIVIYNNFSATAQKFVINTRFQTPEGLTYYSLSPVTIPGKTTVGGKSTAGSVEVKVQAEKAGAEYNVGLKDFTIPGLKGTTKYSTIYARSKTEMSGGFSGMQKVVSKDVLDSADREMDQLVKDAILKDIESGIPANFVFYPGSVTYSIEKITQGPANTSTGSAVLEKKGAGISVIFDRGTLTKAILTKTKPDVASETVKITNLNSLNFTYATGTTIGNVLNFSLTGDAKLVWIFDENKLKSDLLGLSKGDAETVIRKLPGVQEAWVETRPFWSGTIPNNPDKVTLINTVNP